MEKNISVELFFMTLYLIDSLEDLILLTTENLKLEIEEENNSERHQRKVELLKKEIELTELQIVVSNDEIDEILEEINLSELDEIIKDCNDTHPEFIDRLLDIRSKKYRLFK